MRMRSGVGMKGSEKARSESEKGKKACQMAVIFDMDGVIVDNMPFHREAWKRFFEKYNPGMEFSDFIQHLGKPNRDLLRMLFGERISDEEVRALGEEKEAVYREIYAPHIVPLPGFIEFLKALKRNSIKTAIATAAPRANLDFLFEKIEVRGYFDVLVDVSEVEKGKPDPAIYLKAAEKLGFPPESCLVFEDSLAGIKAARNAGMKVIAVATTNPPEKLRDTDVIIKDFTEITIEKISRLLAFSS